jgi:hypothetical protein
VIPADSLHVTSPCSRKSCRNSPALVALLRPRGREPAGVKTPQVILGQS